MFTKSLTVMIVHPNIHHNLISDANSWNAVTRIGEIFREDEVVDMRFTKAIL